MKKGFFLILLVILCIVSLTACSATEQYFVYGTLLDVTAKGVGSAKLSESIYDYIDDLESLFSPTVSGSDINRINSATAGQAVTCSKETMQVIKAAEELYKASNGAYDPSVYPLVRLWQFSGDLFALGVAKVPPSNESIDDAKALVGFTNAFSVDYDNNSVTKKAGYDGAMLDLGGVAKGYAASTAGQLAKEKQKALINLGGNITAANADYTVGIGNPRESNTAYFGSFTLHAGESISTSGDYERYYNYEGVRYHHVLDPMTGRPCDSGLISVSIISCDGALGDAASTAVMVLGKDKGIALINALGFKAVLIDSELNYTVVGDLDFTKK